MISSTRFLPRLGWLLALAAAVAPREAQAETYAVDPATSQVRIHLGRTGLLKFLGHDHEIDAPVAEGRVEVDGDPARARVVLRFTAERLRIVAGTEPAGDIPTVEARMRGPEVLDVARYPEIAFASTSVRSQTTEGTRVRILVAGTLTLRGRSFPVGVPLEVVRENLGLEARGGLDLNLRDLGIEPPAVAGVVKVANRFRLEFEIRATAADRP
jgi:polyisoprenoid-binding protein YceI